MRPFRFERTCPKCGSFLMLREGEFVDFLACPKFPACRYTEPLRNDQQLQERKSPEYYRFCKKCNHTGLLPHPAIKHAWLDCDCKEPPRDYHTALTPSDFDFACSDSWRGYYHEEFGGRDPANTGSYRELPDITAIENRINDLEAEASFSGSIPRRYTEELQQVTGQVLFLQEKVNEMRARRKKKEDSYY